MTSKQRLRRLQVLQHAEGYLELGMAVQALTALDALDEDAGQDGSSLYLRGEALRALERYDEAIVALREAAEVLPENIHLWMALGWCYKRTGHLEQAIEALEMALAVEPAEAILYYNLACYSSLARHKSEALDYLSQAFELDGAYRDLVHQEPDFDSLRHDPDFQALATVIV